MSDTNFDPDSFLEWLTNKAINTGHIFSANERSKDSFYYSHNVTLKEIANLLTLEQLI